MNNYIKIKNEKNIKKALELYRKYINISIKDFKKYILKND